MARPTAYREDYATQAYKLALVGMTDAQMADFFEVAVSTFARWKRMHRTFSDALKRGKGSADAEVAKALYRKATGYSHKAVKIFLHEGKAVIVPYTEKYPPDSTACIFWLKNRQREQWRDRQADGDTPGDPLETARQISVALKAMDEADGLRAA
jgi:hypothetical protein